MMDPRVKADRDGVNPGRPKHMPQVRAAQQATKIHKLQAVIANAPDDQTRIAAMKALSDLRPKP